jgi:hypothetical protein
MKRRPSVTKEELVHQLSLMVKPEAIEPWFNRKNEHFDGFTPNELIERGEEHLIQDMIYDMMSGNPT